MDYKEAIDYLWERTNVNFWGFRCNFMHHPSSIPFDLPFFKLAKNADIAFGTSCDDGIGLYSFKDKTLNNYLDCKNLEEYSLKLCILSFSFLRKELLKAKKEANPTPQLGIFLDLFFEAGEIYGRLNHLEFLKRQAQDSQANSFRHPVFTFPIGQELDKVFKLARQFRPNHKTSRVDALGKVLKDIVFRHATQHGKMPQYSDVIQELDSLALAPHSTIQEVDYETEEVYWLRAKGIQADPTSFKQIRERLTPIRKEVRKRIRF